MKKGQIAEGNVQIYSAGKQAADISAFPEGIAVAVGSEEDTPDICVDQTIDKVFTIENCYICGKME